MTKLESNKSTTYFPDEVELADCEILDMVIRGPKSWSSRITYKNENLKLQTPIMLTSFDLNAYNYAGQSKDNYSLCVSLDETVDGVAALKRLIEKIDATTINTFKSKTDGAEFISSIKEPKDKESKFPPVLRCKLVSNAKRFKCAIYVGGKEKHLNIDECKNLLKKGTKVKLVLQLNPVWKVDNKYGVSWQILALDVVQSKVEFRNDFN